VWIGLGHGVDWRANPPSSRAALKTWRLHRRNTDCAELLSQTEERKNREHHDYEPDEIDDVIHRFTP